MLSGRGNLGSWRLGRHLRPGMCALAAGAASLIFAAPAGAHRRHFPIPHCKWASRSLVSQTFGVQVNEKRGRWKTQIAPVLSCRYVETQTRLTAAGRPIVSIEFREMQRFHPLPGSTYVPHLGSCVRRSSCPRGHKAAWILVERSGTTVSGVLLMVEDGLNQIDIAVENPYGPLPVASETRAVKRLARHLIRRFRWK